MTRKNKILLAVIAILLICASLALRDGVSPIVTKNGDAATPAAETARQNVYEANPIARIARDCSPAVVNIDTETMVRRSPLPFSNDPFFKEFFGDQLERYNRAVPMRGKGSGFIVDAKGYILTNNHVVEGADKITVTMLDGRHFPATLIGKDPTFDLAVIQIKAERLPILTLGDSDKTEVGEWVVAIGNPHGFENSVTAGVVSGKNRTLQASDVNFQGFLQTDAAINPGNSGGPLIDLNAEVIGINTAIVPYAQGMGFAVPVNMAKQIMSDLITHGEVRRGWLGVTLQTVTPGFAETYGLSATEGAIIADISSGSPAAGAGLQRGDVIVAVGGQKVKSSQDVVLYIRNRLAGDKVSLEIFRDGAKKEINVVLGDIPGREGSKPPSDSPSSERRRNSKLGASVSDISDADVRRRNLPSKEGVIVTGVEQGSIASELGLRPGDVVIEVDRKEIKSIEDWEKHVPSDPKTLVLLVRRGEQTLFFTYQKQ